MVYWRGLLRLLLVLVVIGVGGAVFFGLSDRTAPMRPLVVERIDPDAVIQTRGSRIVQADAFGENLRVVSDLQSTYSDGALRLMGNVKATVADREDRGGFELTGDEATVDAEKTGVLLMGGVRLQSNDGVSAVTEEASYSNLDGVVRMPNEATFSDDGMVASGDGAEFTRDDGIIRLFSSARVDLKMGESRTTIRSETATLAQTQGFMNFERDVTIETGAQRMTSNTARADLLAESAQLETLVLAGRAAITTTRVQPGGFRELAADDIRVAYGEEGYGLSQAVLTGHATLAPFAENGSAGSQISGQSMRVDFSDDGSALSRLVASTDVLFTLPEQPDKTTQSVTADLLTATNTSGQGLDDVRFEGAVEFREVSARDDQSPRVTHANRLNAVVAGALTSLEQARFLGDVVFENGEVVGESDEVEYSIDIGQVELLTGGPEGRTPRLVDRRGSVQADTITLGLDDGRIVAAGEVKSVLTNAALETTGEEVRRPGLLNDGEDVNVIAERMEYDAELQLATYTGGARLWQTDTEFRAEEIVLDEANGNISSEGNVQTRSLMNQVNDETGLKEESVTRGWGDRVEYDDELHRATYTTDARLTGPRGDMTADKIVVFLEPDSRTLERVEATGGVELKMVARWITGESMTYYDADGRYEMGGEPVRIIEEMEDGCRETTGRRVTFFLIEDAVSVDGESEVRTETSSGECPETTP